MLHHLNEETYNNEQVLKIFRQNFSWNMPKNGLFWYSKSQKSPSTRAPPPDTLVSVAGWFAPRLLFRL